MRDELLRVEELYLHYRTSRGVVQAVDGVSFEVARNQALAIIGESGCGKSSLARAILRLLPPNVALYRGRVFLEGKDVMTLSEEDFRQGVRWLKLSLVPQAALNTLNPVLKVGVQVAEPLLNRHLTRKGEAQERAREAFSLVGVPADFFQRYAFELSGGMRQRTAIAMALVTGSPLVILDEPTSALDVLTQASIINTFKRIKKEGEKSFILITHDAAIASELADRVAVMYAGQLVEISPAAEFYHNPLHPYSQGLMASVPRLRQNKRPEFISGQPASLINPALSCRFAPRCPYCFSRCEQLPPLLETTEERKVRCWLHA
ncbi:MAG: ABC transporter ATP-binding protein [Dehalococcoidales bacterium]|nr:ABC transporter ATP-binding protein [Dehalococcoidales bacterium]